MRIATPIETQRLRLRPFRDDGSDLEALLAVLGDAESMRYYPSPFDRAGTRTWIDRQLERYERDGFGLLAVEDRATSEVIGDCGPTVQEADGESYVELGWHVLRARQRQGIATEAGAACRDAAFASLDVPFLISLIRPENAPSRRVAEKLGFDVWRGTIRAGWGHLIYRLDRPG
ncbi:MAG: GNAT family N-acetyltransferase [Actinobacteria bacterium]|nr:GNAT family N-acetyltransferase [Actinomycetota bacterium]